MDLDWQDELIKKLAYSQGRRDEVPNQELAREIVSTNDDQAIAALVGYLGHKDKRIAQDSIKVLYEIGEKRPILIAPYVGIFRDLLSHKNNRLVWGGMTALDTIVLEIPDKLCKDIDKVLEGMNKGSVIAKDRGVSILAKLASLPDYTEKTFPLLMDTLWKCPAKQLPMYAEKSMIAVNEVEKASFLSLLNQRMQDLEKESQRKRVQRLMRKLR